MCEITRRRAYRAASWGILADPDPAVRKSNRREGFGALEHLTVGRYGEPPEDPLLLFSVLYAAAIPSYIAFNGDLALELAAWAFSAASPRARSLVAR